jgi:hypothetical protein
LEGAWGELFEFKKSINHFSLQSVFLKITQDFSFFL